MKPVDSLLGNIRALLAQPVGGGGAGAPIALDLNALGDGSAAQVFGCNCSTNPSGLSEAEMRAAQAENLRQTGNA